MGAAVCRLRLGVGGCLLSLDVSRSLLRFLVMIIGSMCIYNVSKYYRDIIATQSDGKPVPPQSCAPFKDCHLPPCHPSYS